MWDLKWPLVLSGFPLLALQEGALGRTLRRTVRSLFPGPTLPGRSVVELRVLRRMCRVIVPVALQPELRDTVLKMDLNAPVTTEPPSCLLVCLLFPFRVTRPLSFRTKLHPFRPVWSMAWVCSRASLFLGDRGTRRQRHRAMVSRRTVLFRNLSCLHVWCALGPSLASGRARVRMSRLGPPKWQFSPLLSVARPTLETSGLLPRKRNLKWRESFGGDGTRPFVLLYLSCNKCRKLVNHKINI